MVALNAFKNHNFANKIHVVREGAEVLECVFCTVPKAGRHFENIGDPARREIAA